MSSKPNKSIQISVTGASPEELQRIRALIELEQESGRLSREILWKDSIQDELTGVGSFQALSTLMKQQVGVPIEGPTACLFVDLDDFKQVNDQFGHAAGNEVLRQVGALLQQSLRESDRVFRYGGDEFVILCGHCDQETAQKVAARLRQKFKEARFLANGTSLSVTASVGVAVTGSISEDLWALLQRADAAMYQEKRTFKGETTLS